MSSLDKTMYFNFEDNNQKDVRETLETVYDALEKKGRWFKDGRHSRQR